MIALLVVFGITTSQAQNAKGDWYIGTGNISDVAWTDWSISPTVGYAFSDALVVGASVSQTDSEADIDLSFYGRYFVSGVFVHAALNGLDFEAIELGLGKQFVLRNNVYIDPAVIYNAGNETLNLGIGFGFKF